MNSFTLDDEWGMEGFNVTSGLEMGNKRLAGMRPNAPFKLHTDWITKVAYLSHSGCIVTSSMDSSLRMVDLERKKLKWAIEEHVKGVYSFEFCRSLNIIASCGVERQVRESDRDRRSLAA
jgi:WD40 repeat protein